MKSWLKNVLNYFIMYRKRYVLKTLRVGSLKIGWNKKIRILKVVIQRDHGKVQNIHLQNDFYILKHNSVIVIISISQADHNKHIAQSFWEFPYSIESDLIFIGWFNVAEIFFFLLHFFRLRVNTRRYLDVVSTLF